jgi:ABC-type dipeptide/oligopeptide/nickel transport system permease component
MHRTRLHVFVARRLALMVPVLLGIMTITFFVTRIIPGDPAYLIAGPFASPETIQSLQAQLGTDQPLFQQYVQYVGDAAHLDFGTSIFTGQPVLEELARRLPSTLELIVLSLGVALTLGILAGAYAARRRGRPGDVGVRIGSFVLLSLPDFWLGLILLYLFFFLLGWAPPPIGQIAPTDPQPADITGAALIDSIITLNGGAFRAAFAHVVLPVVTLGAIFSAPIARLTRSAMLEIRDADYVRFGRSCGLPSRTLWRYEVRAALPPVITFAGILFSALIGGAVLVETVFSWGGAAQFAADSINQRDYPSIQGFVLVASVISVFVFLVVDLLYLVIDPRVRL